MQVIHVSRIPIVLAALLLVVPRLASADAATCLHDGGDAVTQCLQTYVDTIDRCRRGKQADCETTARATGGTLDAALAALDAPLTAACAADAARALGFFDATDVVLRGKETCKAYAEDVLAHTSVADRASLDGAGRRCAKTIPVAAGAFAKAFVKAFADRCIVPAFAGTPCDRTRRDRKVARARSRFRRAVSARCRRTFDGLELVDTSAAATIQGRIDVLVDLIAERLHRFVQHAYPPNDVGPTAYPGPFPVGVRTFALFDMTRMNVAGTGPRPVTIEVYYPSTAQGVAGVPEDPVRILGFDIARQPAYRDVPARDGTFPLVVYSHGYFSIRVAAATLATHLASHGFIVVAAEHHGGDIVDLVSGVEDRFPFQAFPTDDRFAIDRAFEWSADPTSFLAGRVDAARVAVVGQELGAHSALVLAGGESLIGTRTDPRVKAIVPQVPVIQAFTAAFFPTVSVPTLVMAATVDQQRTVDADTVFDGLPGGATFGAEVTLVDGGYNSFIDVCEVPLAIRSLIDPSGEAEACGTYHLPWRHARQIVNHLILNFLDGVLNGNADAMAALDPARVAGIEDVIYRRK